MPVHGCSGAGEEMEQENKSTCNPTSITPPTRTDKSSLSLHLAIYSKDMLVKNYQFPSDPQGVPLITSALEQGKVMLAVMSLAELSKPHASKPELSISVTLQAVTAPA